jgi:hypothetical protein
MQHVQEWGSHGRGRACDWTVQAPTCAIREPFRCLRVFGVLNIADEANCTGREHECMRHNRLSLRVGSDNAFFYSGYGQNRDLTEVPLSDVANWARVFITTSRGQS